MFIIYVIHIHDEILLCKMSFFHIISQQFEKRNNKTWTVLRNGRIFNVEETVLSESHKISTITTFIQNPVKIQ